jgi:hypothetical protein
LKKSQIDIQNTVLTSQTINLIKWSMCQWEWNHREKCVCDWEKQMNRDRLRKLHELIVTKFPRSMYLHWYHAHIRISGKRTYNWMVKFYF